MCWPFQIYLPPRLLSIAIAIAAAAAATLAFDYVYTAGMKVQQDSFNPKKEEGENGYKLCV
jgi:hypothetical protein